MRRKPLEVVGIPLEAPGLYIVEIESPRLGASLLGKPQSMFVPTSVLVTNLAVHFKWGREASLIWVTTLDEGRPAPQPRWRCTIVTGKTLWADRQTPRGLHVSGSFHPRKRLPHVPMRATCLTTIPSRRLAINRLDGGLFVTATLAEDFSFVHSSWDRGIEPWRFQLPLTNAREAIITHTVLDRSLLRAGDTVPYETPPAAADAAGFSSVPAEQLPIASRSAMSAARSNTHCRCLGRRRAIAESTWTIPKGAKLGRYQVVLLRQAPEQGAEESDPEPRADFRRISRRRIPCPFAARLLQPPSEPQIGVTELPVEVGVQYLAGGGASHLPVTLRAQIRPKKGVLPGRL